MITLSLARRIIPIGAVVVLVAGCHKTAPGGHLVRTEPMVQVVHPERRTIVRTVGQPAFINAYEQTSIYPKVAGYIKEWKVDIGDSIKKDQLLAELEHDDQRGDEKDPATHTEQAGQETGGEPHQRGLHQARPGCHDGRGGRGGRVRHC